MSLLAFITWKGLLENREKRKPKKLSLLLMRGGYSQEFSTLVCILAGGKISVSSKGCSLL